MIIYSIIMFFVAAIMIAGGIAVFCGHTELIHSYHQESVTDKSGYGKAMGKALMGISIPLTLSGIIGLFDSSVLPVAILLIGLIIAIIPLFTAQKKYNGGLF